MLQRLLRRFLLTEPELALSYGPDSQPRAVVEAIAATPNSHSATSGRTRHDVPRSRPTSPLMYCRFPAKHSIDAKTCRRPSPPARALHLRFRTKLEECEALVGIESLIANRINAVAGRDSSGPTPPGECAAGSAPVSGSTVGAPSPLWNALLAAARAADRSPPTGVRAHRTFDYAVFGVSV